MCVCLMCFFFCKQKTAYEMLISDWSSDVCSSDLLGRPAQRSSGLKGATLMKQRSYLALEGIGVTFPTKKGPFTAIRDSDLSIEKGEFVTLIGHSGCGKSTLLNIIPDRKRVV